MGAPPHRPRPALEADQTPEEEESLAQSEARIVAEGRATRTPFVAMAGVAAVVWIAAGLIALAVLLVWWLG
jgi:hypothetical protein